METKAPGPACKTCVTLERTTREAVAELGLDAEIEKVTDYAAIASWGILRTPGLVVNGVVVVSGRVPKKDEVKALIRQSA